MAERQQTLDGVIPLSLSDPGTGSIAMFLCGVAIGAGFVASWIAGSVFNSVALALCGTVLSLIAGATAPYWGGHLVTLFYRLITLGSVKNEKPQIKV